MATLLPSADLSPAEAIEPVGRRRSRAPRRSIKLHRWIGWGLGAWILFESVTGSYLALADDLDRWTHQDRYAHTEGDVGPTAAAAATAQAADGNAGHVHTPASYHGVYLVEVRNPEGTDVSLVTVDPGTGEVNDVRGPGRSIHTLVLELHRAFNRTEILGFGASTLVGYLGLAWLIALVVGYRASRPHRRSLKQAGRVRRDRGRYTFQLDLHKTIGLAVIVPTVVIVVTGLTFEFRTQTRAVVSALTPGEVADEGSFKVPFSIPQGNPERLDLDAVAAAVEEQGLGELQNIEVPIGNPAGTFIAVVDVGGYSPAQGEGSAHGNLATIYLDQYTAEPLAVDDAHDRAIGQLIYDDYLYSVHFGEFGRWWTKVAWALVGVLVVVLGVTAVNMRRARWAKRRARPAVPTPTQGAS